MKTTSNLIKGGKKHEEFLQRNLLVPGFITAALGGAGNDAGRME